MTSPNRRETTAVESMLEVAFPRPEADQIEPLIERVAEAGRRAGTLDIAYTTIDSPIGTLLIAATAVGVVRVGFETEGHDDVLEMLARTLGPRILRSDRQLESVKRQLGEYFDQQRSKFDVAVDLRLVRSEFRRTVIGTLSSIAYGTTVSYATLAEMCGNPSAVRAAGTACANNPVPVIVPCHRVVRSDGTIGNYLGGSATKVRLLSLEAAAIASA